MHDCDRGGEVIAGPAKSQLVKLGGEAMETVFIKIFNRVLVTGKLPRSMQI
jgi:hypothetical protein